MLADDGLQDAEGLQDEELSRHRRMPATDLAAATACRWRVRRGRMLADDGLQDAEGLQDEELSRHRCMLRAVACQQETDDSAACNPDSRAGAQAAVVVDSMV